MTIRNTKPTGTSLTIRKPPRQMRGKPLPAFEGAVFCLLFFRKKSNSPRGDRAEVYYTEKTGAKARRKCRTEKAVTNTIKSFFQGVSTHASP